MQLGLDAFERALGARPLLIRSGGSLPIVPAFADKGIPTVITGFTSRTRTSTRRTSACVAEYVPLGIASARELFDEFAAL